MAQYLALPINDCTITAMYKGDSSPAYQHEWDSAGHFGLDMYGSPATFYASGNGKVVGVGGTKTTGVGYWAAIQYESVYRWDMNNSTESAASIVMRYFHLKSEPSLTVGQNVTLDTVIGTIGNTGQWHQTMRPHLHIEADTDTAYPLYTPTLTGAAGGLKPGIRGSGDTTFDPCTVLWVKKSSPENQNLYYSQSKCGKHPNANEYYINVSKMNMFATKTFR